MAEYKIYFKASVEKDLRQIPSQEIKKILQRISLLTADPRPVGCEKLTGQERYRIRHGNIVLYIRLKLIDL